MSAPGAHNQTIQSMDSSFHWSDKLAKIFYVITRSTAGDCQLKILKFFLSCKKQISAKQIRKEIENTYESTNNYIIITKIGNKIIIIMITLVVIKSRGSPPADRVSARSASDTASAQLLSAA